MTVWIIISGIIAPSLFWSGYFYYKDRFQPEPIRNLGIAYLLGWVAAYACLKFYSLFPLIGLPDDPTVLIGNKIQFFTYSFIGVGLVEEIFKFLPFLFVVLRFKAFDEKIDGIIYASMIALGFASFENLGYLVQMQGFELFGRAFASPLTHTIFSSIWGYTVGIARVDKKPLLKASFIGLFTAAFFHGLFNYFMFSPILRVTASVFILIIWIWRIRILKRSREREASLERL